MYRGMHVHKSWTAHGRGKRENGAAHKERGASEGQEVVGGAGVPVCIQEKCWDRLTRHVCVCGPSGTAAG